MHTIQPDYAPINPGFYQLAYCSLLKEPLSTEQIDALVLDAQQRNARNDVTGLLMIDQGIVVQWIEGRRDMVRQLWDKLLMDPRHHCIVQLMHLDFQEQRVYPDWAMQRATRQDIVSIVRSAKELADMQLGLPNPWAGAIAALSTLIGADKEEGGSLPPSWAHTQRSSGDELI